MRVSCTYYVTQCTFVRAVSSVRFARSVSVKKPRLHIESHCAAAMQHLGRGWKCLGLQNTLFSSAHFWSVCRPGFILSTGG